MLATSWVPRQTNRPVQFKLRQFLLQLLNLLFYDYGFKLTRREGGHALARKQNSSFSIMGEGAIASCLEMPTEKPVASTAMTTEVKESGQVSGA